MSERCPNLRDVQPPPAQARESRLAEGRLGAATDLRSCHVIFCGNLPDNKEGLHWRIVHLRRLMSVGDTYSAHRETVRSEPRHRTCWTVLMKHPYSLKPPLSDSPCNNASATRRRRRHKALSVHYSQTPPMGPDRHARPADHGRHFGRRPCRLILVSHHLASVAVARLGAPYRSLATTMLVCVRPVRKLTCQGGHPG